MGSSHAGGEHGARRVGAGGALDQRGDGGGPQQRRVAGQHEHVGVGVVELVVGKAVSADADGVAGAALDVLLDELERHLGRGVQELLGDPLGAVADDDDRAPDLAVRERVEHVEHHGPPAQQVQRLGPGRPHPGALAGGEDDGGEGPRGHGPFLVRSGATLRGWCNWQHARFWSWSSGFESLPPSSARHDPLAGVSDRLGRRPPLRSHDAMGSLIKKRRKRMRKKKHKKMLKRTRFQRRAAGK